MTAAQPEDSSREEIVRSPCAALAAPQTSTLGAEMPREPEIYCPECEWRPGPDDRWSCLPGCGTSWNTFWTGGLCPGCQYKWLKTQCLACGVVSLHKHWYHYPDGEPESNKEQTDVPETVST